MGRRAPKTQNGRAAAQRRAKDKERFSSRASSSSSIVLCDEEDTYVPSKKRTAFSASGAGYSSFGETPREDELYEPRRTARERSTVNYAAMNSPDHVETVEDSVAEATPSSSRYTMDLTETKPDSLYGNNGYSHSSSYTSSLPKSTATVKLTSASYASKHIGPQAEEVIGSGILKGELHLLIKWKDSEEADMIPAKVARYKYPDVVIPFYEKKYLEQCKESQPPVIGGRKSFP